MGMIWHDLEAIIALFCEEPVASGRPVRYSELAAFLITSAPLDGDLNVLLDHEARHANSSLNPCASTSKSMSTHSVSTFPPPTLQMVALNRSIDSENIQIAFDRREVRLASIEV